MSCIQRVLAVVIGTILSMGNAFAQEVTTVYLSDTQVAPILISTRGTVLSFPTKPSKVIIGNTGSFGVEYVENDLAVSPLTTQARSNLFVYMLGRRFTLDLRTSMPGGASIVVVRDAIEKPVAKAQKGKSRGKK